MQKHAAVVLVMAFLMAGAIFAQGVAITQPLNGLITSDANQRVTYVFADPWDVDETSIVLNVDGVDYIVGDPEITWTLLNFHYDVDPAWTEGVHNLEVSAANDTLGDPIAGIPLETNFTVDISGPYLDSRSPGTVGETEPFTTTNVVEPVIIDIVDDWGFINSSSIQVEIDGVIYDEFSAGVYLTVIPGGYRFEFYPDSAGIEWDENDWVEVELLAAEDSPDYGTPNGLLASADNAFGFFVDADGPESYPVYPIPFFREIAYTGCSDIELIWRIEDENAIDLTTFAITINTITYNWGDYRIVVDTIDAVVTVMDTFVDPITGDTTFTPLEWDVLVAEFTFTPNPYWYEGIVYTIYPPTVNDIYGNPATGWYWGAYPWTDWMLMFDNTGPSVSNPYPEPAYVTRDTQEIISFDVTDTWGAVNPVGLHLIIEASSGGTWEYATYYSVTYPEITWDGTTYTFYPSIAGITWPQGDTIRVTVWDVMDSVEFCEGNHMEGPPFSWTFYVADGPMVGDLTPGDDEFSSCQTQLIAFELIDPDGIDASSVLFEVEGYVFDITYETMIIDTYYIGPIMVVDTTYYYPFYEESPGKFVLDPTLLPPGMLDYTDAMEVNCAILAADDGCGHSLWGGEFNWRFWMDFSGPYPGPTYPAAGAVVGGPYPVFSMDIYDDVCGRIDPAGINLQIRGVNFNPLIDPGVTFMDIPGGGRVTVDTEMEGMYYSHGSIVNVCLTAAYDYPHERCTIWGNIGTGLPYCFTFTVDNNPPVPAMFEPLEGEVSACQLQPIIIEVTDDYGVDPSYFQLIVNGIVYNWGDPRLTWDGTYLTYTPTSAYPEGTVEWSLARVGDAAGNVDASSPISGATFIADYSAPLVIWTEPSDDELITITPDFIKLGIDDPAGVDIMATQVTIEVYVDETTLVATYIVDEATFPGVFTFDDVSSELWLDMAIAGITFDYTLYNPIVVTVNFADNPDYVCPDANAGDYQFDFGINPGWEIELSYYPTGDTLPLDTYHFGAYYDATDEYDDGLDELVPPAPPDETPLSFLTPGDGTALSDDYRGLDTESWAWRMYTGTQEGCIYWNPANLPALGSFVINGMVDMRTASEYCFGTDEIIEINVPREIMMLASGWNLVSVPVIAADPAVAAVFPMVDPLDVWEYTGGTTPYEHPTVVQPGHAYFILYTPGPSDPDPIYFSVPGAPITSYERTVLGGWQTLGSCYNFGGILFADIVDVPSGSVDDLGFWLDPFAGTYVTSDVFVAGKGYWNYIDIAPPFGTCDITASSRGGGRKAIPTPTEEPEWMTTITFTDETSRDITIGGLDIASDDYDRGLDILVPPALPGAEFDVYILSLIHI